MDELEEPELEEPVDEPLPVELDVLVDEVELELPFELDPVPLSLLAEPPEELLSPDDLLSLDDFAVAPAVVFSRRLSLR